MVYYCEILSDGNGYMVQFPDMPNVLTGGDTIEDCKLYAWEALNGVLESMVARGSLPPEPTTDFGGEFYPVEVEPHIDIAIQLRRIRGETPQKVVAEKLGFSQQAYQRFENPSKSNPTVKTLAKLAQVMGKNLHISFG